MQCKNHPSRRAEHFCAGCGIALCGDCSEEVKPGQFFCFQCAMHTSVSAVGTTIKDKREKSAEKKEEAKKKWTPFRYFVVVAGVLILVMWGVILFGGQQAPAGTLDFANQPRVLLFMIDSSIKRYAHYEGNQYPAKLSDLIPKYLRLQEQDLPQLQNLSYERDQALGYRLSLAKPKPGENIVITAKGIKYESS
jgi:B-box zinc finger